MKLEATIEIPPEIEGDAPIEVHFEDEIIGLMLDDQHIRMTTAQVERFINEWQIFQELQLQANGE
jgi:hypothetical protein